MLMLKIVCVLLVGLLFFSCSSSLFLFGYSVRCLLVWLSSEVVVILKLLVVWVSVLLLKKVVVCSVIGSGCCRGVL